MINILHNENCCDCTACSSVCPKRCISMHHDEEGFLYPSVDLDACVNCGPCESVCPCLNPHETVMPLSSYAAQNTDLTERVNSSSGGVFSLLAKQTLKSGGVVVGAAFDDAWNVRHIIIDKEEDLHRIRGSKYVQSNLVGVFQQVKRELQVGREVLFSGTPCQVAGLHGFLRKKYDNILTVEVACHGVPSPIVWDAYKEAHFSTPITSVCFRDKTGGWRSYRLTVNSGSGNYSVRASQDDYMRGFSNNLYLRPSCHQCPAKNLSSGSDILLADFWGIEHFLKGIDDNKGVSFVVINTQKGEQAFRSLGCQVQEVNFQEVVKYNSCIVSSTHRPKERERFWALYREDGISAIAQMNTKMTPTMTRRVINKIKRILSK